jgi:hypothetical protein
MLLITARASAQYSDVGLWTNIFIEKKISKKFSAHFETQSRFNQYVSTLYYTNAELGGTVKPSPWFNISAGYVITGKEARRGGVILRNQYYASILFKARLGWFRFSDRNMFQSKNNDSYFSDESINFRKNYYRNKLTLKANLTRKIQPYVAGELYYELNDPEGNDFSRSRTYAGVEYQLTKKSQLEFYYLMQKELHQRYPQTDHVIGIGYALYLK